MDISSTDPIARAWEHTVEVCFRPFDLGKWFGLGFCAWLAMLIDGGTGTANIPGAGDSEDIAKALSSDAFAWVRNHLPLIMAGAAVIAALLLLIAWLSSRGEFMFIDGIVKNGGAVAEPWSRLREQGNSLLAMRLLLFVVFGGGMIVILAALAAEMWPDLVRGDFDGNKIGNLIIVGTGVAALAFVGLIASVVLHNLIVPTMYARRCGASVAWDACRKEMFPGHASEIIIFFILKLILSIGAAIISGVIVLLTCCVAALPYVGTVILLPVAVFLQSYTLFFVDQFGPGFRVFGEGDAGAPATPAIDSVPLP